MTARYEAGGDATAVRVLALLMLRDGEPSAVAARLKEHVGRQAPVTPARRRRNGSTGSRAPTATQVPAFPTRPNLP